MIRWDVPLLEFGAIGVLLSYSLLGGFTARLRRRAYCLSVRPWYLWFLAGFLYMGLFLLRDMLHVTDLLGHVFSFCVAALWPVLPVLLVRIRKERRTDSAGS